MRVPPVFKRDARATFLFTWTWMVKYEKFFVEARIAYFNASNSRTFMWKSFSSFDHFPPLETTLQYAPGLLLTYLSEWAYGVLVAEFSSHYKVSNFSSTKKVPPWINSPVLHDHCRTPFSVKLIFAPVKDIEIRHVLVKWTGQLMTTGQLTLWDLKLKFIVA